MARKRTIDIEGLLFDPELVKALSANGLLIYIMLWGNAEDWGGFEMNLDSLRLRMGAVKVSQKEMEAVVQKLIQMGKIIPYQVNGKQCGWIRNFFRHQRLNNPSPPTLTLPDWITCELKDYPSGKKYAVYRVIQEKIPGNSADTTSSLPVAYEQTTSNRETKRNQKKPYIVEQSSQIAQQVISYLNERTGKNFSPETAMTLKFISGRLSDGHTLEDFKKVIDIKVEEWGSNEEMSKYLRPTTLFAPSKFESYLNERTKGDDDEEVA